MFKDMLKHVQVNLDCQECSYKLSCLVRGKHSLSMPLETYNELVNTGNNPYDSCKALKEVKIKNE